MNIGTLYSSLVKVKSKLIGSGVWINLGFDEHSYVLTANHNIHDEKIEIFNIKGDELESSYIGQIGELDIAIIKIHSKCDINVGLCLDDHAELKSDSKCWILGFPKSLVKISEYKSIDLEGSILFYDEDIFFRIEQGLPDNSEREHIDGFSGGPIFEITSKGDIYLKGIITDSFDDNFSYKRIRGEKISTIYNNLPEEIKNDICSPDFISNYLNRVPLLLNQDIDEVLLDDDFLKHLKKIDLNDLNECKYFYLPDDRAKATQHISLLTNDNSIKSYLHSRIISLILDNNISKISLNPSLFGNDKLFTIHVTDFIDKHQLIARLIKQDKSLDYANSIILIIYSNDKNDLKFVRKKRISRVIADYSEGREPELYSRELPFAEKKVLKNFLESRKQAGVTFSIINLKFLVDMLINEIENEYDSNELDSALIKTEVIKVINKYD
ncbi:TPA: trypsin-like peptidase domain-containing protein [Enterobacter hormaechei]|nr:trypsin-like peptidase domain-containing protein [Enterobacter hormaechei]